MRQFVNNLIEEINYAVAISNKKCYVGAYQIVVTKLPFNDRYYLNILETDSTVLYELKLDSEEGYYLENAIQNYKTRATDEFINCKHPIFD